MNTACIECTDGTRVPYWYVVPLPRTTGRSGGLEFQFELASRACARIHTHQAQVRMRWRVDKL